jgi:hypothetical protein
MRNPIWVGMMFATGLGTGCSKTAPMSTPQQDGPEFKTVRLHIDGFKKSRSGAV